MFRAGRQTEIAAPRRVADNAWREECEIEKIATVDRQALHLARANRRTRNRSRCFHHRCFTRHADGCRCRAQLQAHIQGGRRTEGELNPLHFRHLKAACLQRQFVRSNRQASQVVESRAVDATSRTNPVSLFVAVIFAPATVAPEGSVTVPFKDVVATSD